MLIICCQVLKETMKQPTWFEKASNVVAKFSMNLTKGGSTRKYVLEKALYNLFVKAELLSNVKVLGLRWEPDADCFLFESCKLDLGLIITKRVVLSLVARVFDHLGFVALFIIKLKCLFQDIWCFGLNLEEEVSDDIYQQVLMWIKDVVASKYLQVPSPFTEREWREIQLVRLAVLSDDSEKSYGACVYLISTLNYGCAVSKLVWSKAKVAPLKSVTFPRLELLGAVLAARLIEFVR